MESFITIILFIFLCSFANANIICVDDSNTSGIENGSLQYPFNTIVEGLAAAQNLDTIIVAAGTYATSYLLIPKSVTIIGAGRDSTIVNGQFVLSSQLTELPVFIYTLHCENVRLGDIDTVTSITPLTIQDCSMQALHDTTKSLDTTCTLTLRDNIVIDSISINWLSSRASIEINNCSVGDNLSISTPMSRKNILVVGNEIGGSLIISTISRQDTIFVEHNNVSDSLVLLSVASYPNFIKNNHIGKGIRIEAVSSLGNQITDNVINYGNIKGTFTAVGNTFIESNNLLNGGIEIKGVSAKVYIRKNIISSNGIASGINFTSKSGGRIDSNSVMLPYIPPTGVPPEYDSAAICAVKISSVAFNGLYDNLLEGGNYGVYLEAVASQIVHNTLSNSDRGIYLEAVSCRVDSNSVTDCVDDGMILNRYEDYDMSAIILNYNFIRNNGGNGIRLKDYATLGTDTTGYNIITDNAGYDLYVEVPKSVTDTIFAKNNRWTHITESEISQYDIYDQNDDTTLAVVILTPFLLTDVDEGNENDILTDFVLYQNYPNPFNPSTAISYQKPVSGNVTLKVYDVLGREVATLVNEYRPAGIYNVEFRIENLELSSGVYFYQLKAGEFIQTKKMIVMK
jgi:hypothetical protein